MKRQPLLISSPRFTTQLDEDQKWDFINMLLWMPMLCDAYELRAASIGNIIVGAVATAPDLVGLNELLDETLCTLSTTRLVIPAKLIPVLNTNILLAYGFIPDGENMVRLRDKEEASDPG